MEQFIHPLVLYTACILGAAGICLALPRRAGGPQLIGAFIAAAAGGIAILAMSLKAGPAALPSIYFYIFAAVALGGALRVITHPRPVYAALYFILTIIATAGLFLILSAEFMAFALIIVYAGAILITYLFVIMLAMQAPAEGEVEVLTEYDTKAREPLAATVAGFLLLAVLTTMMFRGTAEIAPVATAAQVDSLLDDLPRKVERVLENHNMLEEGEKLALAAPDGGPAIDGAAGIIWVEGGAEPRIIERADWPEEMSVKNIEGLGFNLLRDHPGTIEIAGVILLMAMLGAVVLSRKQVQMDEEAKMRQARLLSGDTSGEAGA